MAVAPDGRVAILDSVNGRLVILDADGVFQRAIPLVVTGGGPAGKQRRSPGE